MLERCIDVLKKGKRVIYIAPSRELAEYIRQEFMTGFGGLINTDVIVIDELEQNCAREFLGTRRILPEDIGIMVLKEVMRNLDLEGKLHFYRKVYARYGLLQGLLSTIKKIKRQALSPKELLIKAQDTGDNILIKKAKNLTAIFEAYDRKLEELGFVDMEDMARIAIENSARCTYLEGVELIAVDGYINLDRIDVKLLESIVQNRYIKVIGHVPMNTPFIDSFIEGEIYKDFAKIGAEIVKYDFSREGYFKKLAACLFTGERLKEPPSGIRVLNAPCISEEIRQAAKIIKSLLFEGKTNLENIAVIIGDAEGYRDYIAQIFEEMNLPTSMGKYVKLAAVPLIRDLFLFFSKGAEAVKDGITFETPYMSVDAGSADSVGIAQIHGRINITDKITYYAEELINIIDGLMIKQKLNELYRSGRISSDIYVRDLKAYISLVDILIKIRQEYANFDIQVNFEDFLELFKRHIQEATISLKGGNPAGIKILDPDLLKGTCYDYIFFLGLNEGVFPKAPIKAGVFTSREKQLLAKLGVNLESPGWEHAREKIRFILSVASAKKSLFLSYRTADEDGSYIIKSPFLEELIFTAGIDKDSSAIMDKRSMRQRFSPDIGDAWSLNEAAEKLILGRFGQITDTSDKTRAETSKDNIDKAVSRISGESFDNAAAQLSEETLPPITGLFESLKERAGWLSVVKRAHDIEEQRNSRRFTNYDGRIGPEGARRFDEDYCFSPSRLNSFIYCPFKFFVEQVLQVRVEDDEDVVRARDRGNLYHAILKRYYEGCKDVHIFDEERLREKAEGAFNEAGLTDDDIATFMYKDEILEVLKRFLIKDAAYLSGYSEVTGKMLQPHFLEKSFFDDEIFDGLKFYARVDRVDLEYDGNRPTGRFIIYDYKTKNSKNLRRCLEDRDLQLIIYYHLVKKALIKDLGLPDPECIALLYYSIEDAGFEGIIVDEERKALSKNRGNMDTVSRSNFEFVMDYFKNLAVHVIRDIKKGDFVLPKKCFSYNSFSGYKCKYQNVCRFDATRVLQMR